MAMPMNGLDGFGKWSHLNVIFFAMYNSQSFFYWTFWENFIQNENIGLDHNLAIYVSKEELEVFHKNKKLPNYSAKTS
jgi:hypothetical protein